VRGPDAGGVAVSGATGFSFATHLRYCFGVCVTAIGSMLLKLQLARTSVPSCVTWCPVTNPFATAPATTWSNSQRTIWLSLNRWLRFLVNVVGCQTSASRSNPRNRRYDRFT
jgi:hypothetical protein